MLRCCLLISLIPITLAQQRACPPTTTTTATTTFRGRLLASSSTSRIVAIQTRPSLSERARLVFREDPLENDFLKRIVEQQEHQAATATIILGRATRTRTWRRRTNVWTTFTAGLMMLLASRLFRSNDLWSVLPLEVLSLSSFWQRLSLLRRFIASAGGGLLPIVIVTIRPQLPNYFSNTQFLFQIFRNMLWMEFWRVAWKSFAAYTKALVRRFRDGAFHQDTGNESSWWRRCQRFVTHALQRGTAKLVSTAIQRLVQDAVTGLFAANKGIGASIDA